MKHASRRLRAWLISDVRQYYMYTFNLLTNESEGSRPPKVFEVTLCLFEYTYAEDGSPALTCPCATEEEIEDQFKELIDEILKKKAEAITLIQEAQRQRKRSKSKRPNKSPEPTTTAVTPRAIESKSK